MMHLILDCSAVHGVNFGESYRQILQGSLDRRSNVSNRSSKMYCGNLCLSSSLHMFRGLCVSAEAAEHRLVSHSGSFPAAHKEDISTGASPFTADLIRYPCTAFTKPPEELKVNWRSAFGATTLVFSDMSQKPKPVNSAPPPAGSHLNSLAAERGLYKNSVCQGTTGPNYASGGWQRQSAGLSGGESHASYSHTSKKMRIDHSPFSSNNAQDGAPHSG